MTDITLYHNPQCSKSRAALALLEERGIHATIVNYLDTPLNAEQLSALLGKLAMDARELIRSGESVYSAMSLDKTNLSQAELIDAMVQAPILMQRPILVVDQRAAIGRPLDNLIELLA